MRVLFLHGWHSVPGGVKPTFLKDHGHTVLNPSLHDDDFDAAVRTAQAEFDQHHPDVIVGSSRGGAVAMNIDSGDTPLVLLCPAWKNWGTATKLKPQATILHSRKDDVIPFADSVELVANSGLPPETLIEVGDDHRLADDANTKVVLFAFAAGDGLAEHVAPLPAIIQIIKGEASLTVGEETVVGKPGTWIQMAAKTPHSIKAQTPVVMSLTLLK